VTHGKTEDRRFVTVGLHRGGWPHPARRVQADGEGVWVADFSRPAGDGPWDEAADLGPGTDGYAVETDGDGDGTWADWRVPNPHFNVSADADAVWGHEWPAETTVTITIGDTDPPAEVSIQTDASGAFGHWEEGLGFDVVPGMLVTVTDGATVKTHVVTPIAVTAVDPVNNTISGIASPDAWLHVWAHVVDHPTRVVQADAAGHWSAEFSEPDPQGGAALDIQPGMDGAASEQDDDGDASFARWEVP